MKIFNIELTDAQFNNLVTFLNRTQLSGGEVPAYNDLMNILGKVANPEIDKTVK